MHVFDTPGEMSTWSDAQRVAGRTVALVPTMGALHEGHLALVDLARQHADAVVVSIFVNPLQFNRRDDFDAYPRPLHDDLAACASAGVDAVYAPTAAAMYPEGFDTHVEPGVLAEVLEGALRPGHFRGVTTVVAKLFGASRPHLAVFGQKDYQQLAIIRRLVRDLDFNVVIHGIDTVREEDGLAMSSRNRYLTAEERAQTPALRAALLKAREAYLKGGVREAGALKRVILDHLATHAPLARVDYAEIVDASSLQAPSEATELLVIALAAYFGGARLIDNIEFK